MLITQHKWQERQRTTRVSLIPLSLPSHLHIMSHLDNMHPCTHTDTHTQMLTGKQGQGPSDAPKDD